MPRPRRVVVVYPAYGPARVLEEERFAARRRAGGDEVVAFGLPCLDGWWDFPRLDAAFRAGDRWLQVAYQDLGELLAGADVLLASGGAMLHPRFLDQFQGCKVMVCGDDPENSERLSRPVAAHFDFPFTTNIACVGMYREWGCRNAQWIFTPLRPDDVDPTMTAAQVRQAPRDVPAVLLCERVYGLSDRHRRAEQLWSAFPDAVVRGPGWPGGPVDDAGRRQLYRRSQLGWNLHNSVGPCNTRTMTLPALGVLQVCDNKSGLGRIFELDREVIGFDTIAECIDATRHYLAHPDEARAIAARGFERVLRDYTEERFWQRIMTTVGPWLQARQGNGVLV